MLTDEVRYQWRRFKRDHIEWVRTIQLAGACVAFGWAMLWAYEKGLIR